MAAQGSSLSVRESLVDLREGFGTGAAMAPHGSLSTIAPELVEDLKGLDVDFGGAAAIDPHKSSSSVLVTFDVPFGCKLVPENQEMASIR